MTEVDFLVIGGGIAGASAGYYLAEHGRVLVLERESQPGYHATGRSAALFTENYGNAAIRALTAGSRSFFEKPPAGFADHPLLGPRGVLTLVPEPAAARADDVLAEGRRFSPGLCEIAPDEAMARCPALRPSWFRRALWEPDAQDLDVHAIHQGFLRGLRARGGLLRSDAEVSGIERHRGTWRVTTGADTVAGAVVVDAAGAWADVVAELAGVRPVGLVPKRRTAFIFDPPADQDSARWPLVIDIDERFYVKPESGRLLASPADETPMPPCDVQPDELDIAIAAARLEEATTLTVRRVLRKWAGLRTFAPDKTPVVGAAPDGPGFIFLAGQGGYGIQTAPAMGRIAAALATGAELPDDLRARGLTAASLGVERLRR